MVERLDASRAVLEHRAAWPLRGQERPPFAEEPRPGQRSVWDFPRPPSQAVLAREALVRLHEADGAAVIARSDAAVEVMETASAPTVYFAPESVDESALVATDGRSHCEWKGLAVSYALAPALAAQANIPAAQAVAWRYLAVYPEFESIYGWYAFYPQYLACYLAQERVRAQPGGYYGGWVTDDLAGPIKGAAGSGGW
ncbi:MAG: DUF427 domain-containing protein [Pseudomonadota bacterium]